MKKVILMKVTSRQRPVELIKCIKAYVDLASNKNDMIWLFSFDFDDKNYQDSRFIELICKTVGLNSVITFGMSNNKIHAINRDVNDFEKRWDILLNISDDQLPITKGYDEIIRKTMPADLDCSLWFNDGHQNRINTQEILGRNYYNIDKFIYDPRFKSFFCDNLSTAIATKRGAIIKSEKCIIKHFHPQWEKSSHMVEDELYKKNNKYWKHDEELFHRLIKTI